MVLREGETLYAYYSTVGSIKASAMTYWFKDVLTKYNASLMDELAERERNLKMDVVIFLCYPFDVEKKTFDMGRKYSVILVGEKYVAYQALTPGLEHMRKYAVSKIVAETDCFDPETRTYERTEMIPVSGYSEASVNDYITTTFEEDRSAKFYDNHHTFLDAVRLKLTGQAAAGDDAANGTGRLLRYSSDGYYQVPRNRHFFTKSSRVTNEYVVFGTADRLNPVRNDGVSCSEFLKRIKCVTYDIETVNVSTNAEKVRDYIHCIGLCVQQNQTPKELVCITTADIGEKSCPLVPCEDPINRGHGRGYDWKYSDLRPYFTTDAEKDDCAELTEEDRFLLSYRNSQIVSDDDEERADLDDGVDSDNLLFPSAVPVDKKYNCTDKLNAARVYFVGNELRSPDGNMFPVTRMVRCKSEIDLLKAFFAEIVGHDIHALVGYNNLGFDMKFILRACSYYGIDGVDELSIHISTNVYVKDSDSLKRRIKCLDPFKKGGLIGKKQLELSSNHACGMFETDLYPAHFTTLDTAATRHLKLDTAKLSIGYENIPVLLYGKDPTLLQYYCMRDVMLTSALFNNVDRFICLELFFVLEEVNGTSVSQNFTQKKSRMVSAETYRLFRQRDMVVEADVSPATKYYQLTFADIVDHYLAQTPRDQNTYTRLCRSVIHSQKCNLWSTKSLRVLLKDFYENYHGKAITVRKRAVDMLTLICDGIKKGKVRIKELGSDHLMFLMDHVVRDKISIKSPMRSYHRLIPDTLEGIPSKYEEKALTELNEFVSFLCTHVLTEYDDLPTVTVPLYVKNRGTSSVYCGREKVVVALARALSGNMEEIRAIRTEFENLNPRDKVPDPTTLARRMWDIVTRSGVNVYLKQSKYDGAHLIEPVVGVYDVHSTFCIDMSAYYPNCMLETNMGRSTEISFERTMNLLKKGKIKEEKDFLCINTSRIDDEVDWRRYADAYPEYTKNNYVFFFTKDVCESVYAYQLKRGVALRNVYKYKAQDETLSEQKRRECLSKSNALKIVNNTFYGLFKLKAPSIRFSAAVTSRARCLLKKTIAWCKDRFDVHEVYGDTDSAMFRFGKTNAELIDTILHGADEEIRTYFRTDILGSITPESLREVCAVAQTTGRDDRYVAAVAIAAVSKAICTRLNETNEVYNPPIGLDFEKVMNPFLLPTAKKYAAWKPLEGYYLDVGIQKTFMSVSVDICSKIIEYVRDREPEKIYPYIVGKLIKPCLAGTIDPRIISRHATVNVESKTITDKWVRVINSLRASGKPILFPNQHFNYVMVKDDDEGYYATVEQYEGAKERNAPLQLDLEETLKAALSEPLRRLSAMYNEETFVYFRNLQAPLITESPAVNWSDYRTPSFKSGKPSVIMTSRKRNLLLNPTDDEAKKKIVRKKRKAAQNSVKCPRKSVIRN